MRPRTTWPEVDRSRPHRQSKREVWRHIRSMYCRFDHHLTTCDDDDDDGGAISTPLPCCIIYTKRPLVAHGRDVAAPVDRLALIYYDASACSLCWCRRSDGKTQSTPGPSHQLMSHADCSSDTYTFSSSFVSQRTILLTLSLLSQFSRMRILSPS